MIALIAVLFWAGVHNLRHRRMLAESNHVTLIPAGPASDDAGPPDAEGAELRGKAAPAFTLTDVSGKKISLAEFKGHPVVVNFWATWCGPCKLEMPWFQEFSSKYKDQGLEVLGLSQDDGASRQDVADAAKKIGVSYPILMPDEKVAKQYGGVDYLPETFYIDRAGKVVEVTAGAPSKDQMEALIEKTIAAGGA
jgi:peroxiredoxin